MPKFWESLLFRSIIFIPTFLLFIPIRLGLAALQVVLAVIREIAVLAIDMYDDSLDFWETGEHLANEWREHGNKTDTD